MEHLKIIQTTEGNAEEVSMDVVQKLYDIAANSTLDNESDLQGKLHLSIAYREPVNWLTTHFPNLQISADDYAIPFEDPNMLAYLNSIGVGSNGVVTEAQAAAATSVAFPTLMSCCKTVVCVGMSPKRDGKDLINSTRSLCFG